MGRASHKGRMTRKKFIKKMMSIGYQRNQAELACIFVNQSPCWRKKIAWRSLFYHPKMLNLLDMNVPPEAGKEQE